MRWKTGWIGVLWAAGLLSFGSAGAETIELVTYYPAPGGEDVDAGRLHADAATIGDPYTLMNPAALPNGTLLVAGPVGIGLNFAGQAPAAALEVEGSILSTGPAGADALFIADRAATNRSSGLRLQTNGATQWTLGSLDDGTENFHIFSNVPAATRLFIEQATGNVGIGTTAPSRPLHVVADVRPLAGPPPLWAGQIFVEPAADNEATGISLRSTYTAADRVWSVIAGAGGGTPNTNFRIYDSTAAQDRLNIDTSGNVGVGTVAPQETSPANNVSTGNLDANDVFLRSVNRWASQVGAPQIVQSVLAADVNYGATEKILVSVTVTTGGGPVLIQGKVVSTAPAIYSTSGIRIRRGGLTGPVLDVWKESGNNGLRGAAVMATETPAPGTYTYVLTAKADNNATWTTQAAEDRTRLIVTVF